MGEGRNLGKGDATQLGCTRLTLPVLVAAIAAVFYGCLVGEMVRNERSLISSA